MTLKLLLCLFVLFYSSFVFTCVCVFFYIQSPLRECRSIRSGASGLPYYCAQLVCVPAVLGLLAVWRHNKSKTKNHRRPWQPRLTQSLPYHFFTIRTFHTVRYNSPTTHLSQTIYTSNEFQKRKRKETKEGKRNKTHKHTYIQFTLLA